LNGARYLKANNKGEVEKEWKGKKLLSPNEYAENLEDNVTDGVYKNKKRG
jgi:hypothetical protein